MESFLEYKFNNDKLIETALTHSSYAHESKHGDIENNERLEFLGDAVLELVISSFIFDKFPELPEGELTKLRASVVCESSLAKKAKEIGIGDRIKLGKGEENTGGRYRDSILADAFEAVIGAIYLDGGIESAGKYIIEIMEESIFHMLKIFRMSDCKTYLQEIVQKYSREPIEYLIVDESGPAHNKLFVVNIFHNGKILGKGSGKSKKEAEQNAALDAVKHFEDELL